MKGSRSNHLNKLGRRETPPKGRKCPFNKRVDAKRRPVNGKWGDGHGRLGGFVCEFWGGRRVLGSPPLS